MSPSVSFGTATVYEHALVMGGGIPVSGIPVMLAKTPIHVTTTEIDVYDYVRSSQRRQRKDLLLSARQRSELVMLSGYSMEEMADVAIEMDTIRRQRADSMTASGFGEKIQYFQQSMAKFPKDLVKGVLNIGKTSQNIVSSRTA